MKAPKQILDGWKLQKEHGDIEEIHKISVKNLKPISRTTIAHALSSGRMSPETFDSIKTFYTNKRHAEKQLIAETLK